MAAIHKSQAVAGDNTKQYEHVCVITTLLCTGVLTPCHSTNELNISFNT